MQSREISADYRTGSNRNIVCFRQWAQYKSLRWLFEPVKDEVAYIIENGALPTYKGQTLAVELLERELALRICNDVIAYPECEIMISGIKTSYLMKWNPEYIDFIRNDIWNQVEVKFIILHPAFKLFFSGSFQYFSQVCRLCWNQMLCERLARRMGILLRINGQPMLNSCPFCEKYKSYFSLSQEQC